MKRVWNYGEREQERELSLYVPPALMSSLVGNIKQTWKRDISSSWLVQCHVLTDTCSPSPAAGCMSCMLPSTLLITAGSHHGHHQVHSAAAAAAAAGALLS